MTIAHRATTTAALILSLAAAAPVASATPAGAPARAHHPRAGVYSRQEKSVLPPGDPPARAGVYSRQEKSVLPAGNPPASGPGIAKPSAPATIVRVEAPSGFDWGDAGIGAAGGLALSIIGLGGALGISQHRARRTRDTTAVTG